MYLKMQNHIDTRSEASTKATGEFKLTLHINKMVDLASNSVRIYLFRIESYLKLSRHKLMARIIKTVHK